MDRGNSSIWGTFISSASVLAASEEHASLLVLWDAAFSCKGTLFACQLEISFKDLEAQKQIPVEHLLCAKHVFYSSEKALFYFDTLFLFLTAITNYFILHCFITLFRELQRKEAWWVRAPLESEVTGLKSQLYCFLHVWLWVHLGLSFPICKMGLRIVATSDNWSAAATGRSPLVSFHTWPKTECLRACKGDSPQSWSPKEHPQPVRHGNWCK